MSEQTTQTRPEITKEEADMILSDTEDMVKAIKKMSQSKMGLMQHDDFMAAARSNYVLAAELVSKTEKALKTIERLENENEWLQASKHRTDITMEDRDKKAGELRELAEEFPFFKSFLEKLNGVQFELMVMQELISESETKKLLNHEKDEQIGANKKLKEQLCNDVLGAYKNLTIARRQQVKAPLKLYQEPSEIEAQNKQLGLDNLISQNEGVVKTWLETHDKLDAQSFTEAQNALSTMAKIFGRSEFSSEQIADRIGMQTEKFTDMAKKTLVNAIEGCRQQEHNTSHKKDDMEH